MFTATIIIIMCAIFAISGLFIIIRAENRLKKTTAILNAYYEKYGSLETRFLVENYPRISKKMDTFMGYHSLVEQLDFIEDAISDKIMWMSQKGPED
jgi:hypothetical protein